MHRCIVFTVWLTAVGLASPLAHAETLLERGTYLVETVAACGNCHTPRGPDGALAVDKKLAGGLVLNAPIFTAVASNITPDVETGIGVWSDAEIVTAIREGKRPDGRTLGPPMPFGLYRRLSDRDVQAIVTYLRTVPPVTNKVAPSEYRIPLPAAYGPPVQNVPDVPRDDKVAYGEYLAGPVAHCMECHTPMTDGHPDTARLGAGGLEIEVPGGGLVTAPNITPDPETGIGRWSDAEIKMAITRGVRPDGTAMVPLMAYSWYAGMTQEDLDAIVAYLRLLKPVSTAHGTRRAGQRD